MLIFRPYKLIHFFERFSIYSLPAIITLTPVKITMWHEQRKEEKRIKGMMVDKRKRAERRRDYYEKIKTDPNQFLQVVYWVPYQRARARLD